MKTTRTIMAFAGQKNESELVAERLAHRKAFEADYAGSFTRVLVSESRTMRKYCGLIDAKIDTDNFEFTADTFPFGGHITFTNNVHPANKVGYCLRVFTR